MGNRVILLEDEFKDLHPLTLEDLIERADNLNSILKDARGKEDDEGNVITEGYTYFKGVTADIVEAARNVLREKWSTAKVR